MRNRLTPPLGSKGLFEVDKPFTLPAKRMFEVIELREVTGLFAEHIDVYKLYYEPYKISESDYQSDVDNNVVIVTLLGDDGVRYIPDSYITSYPELGAANYYRSVISIDLGALHKHTNLDGLMKQLAETCSDLLGVIPKVQKHSAPTVDVISQNEAKQLEKVRTGLKKYPISDHLKLKQMNVKNAALVEAHNRAKLSRS